jgi:hypothetical protein
MARPTPQAAPAVVPQPEADDALTLDQERAAWLGERLRRLALGLTATLIAARAYWPAEPSFKDEAGSGLEWAFALLLTVGLALIAALVGGTLRLRWSWTDAAVIGLMLLVALSAAQATDRRPAINLAWESGAVGLAYLLVRNLPRTRAESSALAGILVVTAAAVAVYGLYQVAVELPAIRTAYQRNPADVLRQVGIEPGTPAQMLYEMRLLHSNEPWSTFALTNSLAGFLIGPLVVALAVGWENLRSRDGEGRGSRLGALALAAGPVLLLLICLILTKSRSAYVGLAVALAVLAWRSRRLVRTRRLALVALGGLVVLSALVVAGLKTRQLDPLVLTEAGKSLRYRWEYWVGAWGVITESPRSFWTGVGPGNFGWAYLKQKLPESSEEVRDPHNMILEVWATAGVWAAVALGAALGLGLSNTLGPPSKRAQTAPDKPAGPPDLDGPPRGVGWLVGWGGAGLAMVVGLGRLNLFEGDLYLRWLILLGAWVAVALLGLPLGRRLPIPAAGLGAGALAVAVNLLAAGGIGISSVALMLWTLIALGLNLRDDRACHRLRVHEGRLATVALAGVWAALVGIFVGAIWIPFWTLEPELNEAEAALQARPPDYERAQIAYDRALHADKFSARPWLGLAYLEGRIWQDRGAKPEDQRWRKIPILLLKAVSPPRNPNIWFYHRDRAMIMRDLLVEVGPHLPPNELIRYRANIVEATRTASRLYPTNATLHARLAEASAEIGMFGDAVREAREAFRLDGLTPHADKKLAEPLRKGLQKRLPEWEKATPTLGPAGPR